VSQIILAVSSAADAKKQRTMPLSTLEEALKRTEPFVPARYEEEMKGIADGAKLPLKLVRLMNIFPEQFHCSGFALFGKATQDGKLLHGRILDYITKARLQHYALVTIAQPKGFNTFITVGYTGFIGSVTGMNQKEIAIGEMGGKGQGNWDGMPMSYLVRKALEEADSLDKAVTIFRTTPRTCEYYYVISDGKIPDARGLACTPKMFDVVEPNKFNPRLNKPIADAILLSEGKRYEELVARVKKQYGVIDSNAARGLMTRPVAMEANLHDVLFAPSSLEFWVANAADPSIEKYQACYQKYYHYDLKELLKFHIEN
jgi:isopenicillin-N N-acyltransferase like protein